MLMVLESLLKVVLKSLDLELLCENVAFLAGHISPIQAWSRTVYWPLHSLSSKTSNSELGVCALT